MLTMRSVLTVRQPVLIVTFRCSRCTAPNLEAGLFQGASIAVPDRGAGGADMNGRLHLEAYWTVVDREEVLKGMTI